MKKPKEPTKSAPTTIDDQPVETQGQRNVLMFTHVARGHPLATLENMRDLLNYRHIHCHYNVISKKIMFSIPEEKFSVENREETALACIYSFMKELEMPVDNYKQYLLRIADEHQFNPVLEWIKSKKWDGVNRLAKFYDTIKSPENEAKELLIRRWLITAVCMAKGDGVDSAGCLVLQGPQDLGKTWWVKKLVPEHLRPEMIRTDAMVDPKDKDSVSQVISYWICELGEIGATFRKADIDSLKGFITRDYDIMRRPYGEGDKKYPRRTCLIASVDQTIYLHDTAGNRRFWTIPCTAINSYHDIDMQQLWAEVYDLTERGESWQLEPDEKAHIKRINEEHMQITPEEEMVTKYFAGSGKFTRSWKTCTQICIACEFKQLSHNQTRIVANTLRKLGCLSRRTKATTEFYI